MRESIFRLQEVISPPRYSARKSAGRIEESLARVAEVLHECDEVSPGGDWHVLGLCHDLKNMAQCAEIYFTSALARTESRGWHYREDFPKRDDATWRKWVELTLRGRENGRLDDADPVRAVQDAGRRRPVVLRDDVRSDEVGEPAMQDVKMSDLTPEEKARPFSKYFYKPLTPAAPERVAAMDRPIDPSLALLAENRSDLLNPGDLPCEAGWCVLPDGTGFIANRLPMPGVTAR